MIYPSVISGDNTNDRDEWRRPTQRPINNKCDGRQRAQRRSTASRVRSAFTKEATASEPRTS